MAILDITQNPASSGGATGAGSVNYNPDDPNSLADYIQELIALKSGKGGGAAISGSGGGGGGGSYLENQLSGWASLDPTLNLSAIEPGSAMADAQASIPLGQRMANSQAGNFGANLGGNGGLGNNTLSMLNLSNPPQPPVQPNAAGAGVQAFKQNLAAPTQTPLPPPRTQAAPPQVPSINQQLGTTQQGPTQNMNPLQILMQQLGLGGQHSAGASQSSGILPHILSAFSGSGNSNGGILGNLFSKFGQASGNGSPLDDGGYIDDSMFRGHGDGGG